MTVDLETLRRDQDAWGLVSYSQGVSEEWGKHDLNQDVRLSVLLAMQYDRRDSDVALLRHLFSEEISARKNDDFQGFGVALRLAAFMLAEFRNPADIPLFYQAKFANFDTACGFPIQFLFIPLGSQTSAFLKENHKEIYDDFTKYFGENAMPPDELDAWWKSIQSEYPDSEEKETLVARYKRAVSLKDYELARSLLNEWELHEPESDEKWTHLRYEYEQLGDFREAVRCALNCPEDGLDAWERSSRLVDLIELHWKAGDFESAVEATEALDKEFANFDRWIGMGLGRNATHTVFEFAKAHPDRDIAIRMFRIADGWYQRNNDLALVEIEAGVEAAARAGLMDERKRYEFLAAEELKRIESLSR